MSTCNLISLDRHRRQRGADCRTCFATQRRSEFFIAPEDADLPQHREQVLVIGVME